MNQIQFRIWIILFYAFLLSACASEAEKQERRENSYDLSGDYKMTQATGSEVDMIVSIRNESGRHDIVATVERLSPLTEKERSLLKAQGLDPDVVAITLKNKLVFGKGYNSKHLDGGENISSDFGESTQFYICSQTFRYNSEYSFNYCLTGSSRKKDRVLNGTLKLSWFRERKLMSDGKEVREYSTNSTQLVFKTDISSVFYKQYIGNWRGQVFSLVADFNGASFTTIRIVENATDTFSVSLPATQSLTFRGETYVYDPRGNIWSLEFLKRPEYPAVQMVFYGKFGRRIVLLGQLWSLGNFTGTITQILPDRQLDLATFRMKKE